MTQYGKYFSIASILISIFGALYRWQEFLLIGILFVFVLIIFAAFVAFVPSSSLTSQSEIVATTRLDAAEIRFSVRSRRKRGISIEFSEGPLPYRKFPINFRRGNSEVQIPLDTITRCDVKMENVNLVVSDTFGFFRRTIARCNPFEIIIQPRVFDIPGQFASRSRGGIDEGRVTGWGSQLSELVTEYNPGDEPRRVHWRTSAKVGKLMVRKEIAPERSEVMLCLDADARSYSVTDSFGNNREEYDFEIFHELFVSLALAQAKAGKRVQVLTTGSDAPFDLQHGMTAPFLRLMAGTEMANSDVANLERILRSAKQFQPGQILFVTAKPNKPVLDLLSDLKRMTALTVFGCNMTPDVGDLNIDVRSVSVKTV